MAVCAPAAICAELVTPSCSAFVTLADALADGGNLTRVLRLRGCQRLQFAAQLGELRIRRIAALFPARAFERDPTQQSRNKDKQTDKHQVHAFSTTFAKCSGETVSSLYASPRQMKMFADTFWLSPAPSGAEASLARTGRKTRRGGRLLRSGCGR